ncbi:MAG: GNAT family N-acetyltransferase [Acidimicrobiales bacterium]
MVFDQGVSISMGQPDVSGLDAIVRVLREWQYDTAPMQLHPGDVGWFWRFGPEATARALRTWSRDGRILAVGLLDGPGLLRLAIAPEAQNDESVTRRMLIDVTRAQRGVVAEGDVCIEARCGALFEALLVDEGWDVDESWTPLQLDLTAPVRDCGVRIEVTGPHQARVRADIQRAAFNGSTFTPEHWHAMASGAAYRDARCLVAYNEQGSAVAAATVWSAGAGRPGLLEPVGVHHEHRGRGYGTAISVAAATALRNMGSSSAIVCTESANVAAVATYKQAGFEQGEEVRDFRRRT